MMLADLDARLHQAAPLADGVYTGVTFRCPRDPHGKRVHSVLFEPIINPYGDASGDLARYLAPHTQGPKWQRTGETIKTLTLTPSISYPCCHITITDGKVLVT